jgi:hypothetical protein
MKTVWPAIVVAFAIANGAAAQAVGPTPPGFKITNDEFEPTITVISPTSTLSGMTGEIFLRTFIDKKTKITNHQLYVTRGYAGQRLRNYQLAFDDRGVQHDVVSLNKTVSGCSVTFGTRSCSYSEELGIAISDDQLQDYAKSGVKFKIKGNNAEEDIVLTLTPQLPAIQILAVNPYVGDRLKVDMTVVPPPALGANLEDEGVVNRKLYSGLDQGLHVGVVQHGSPLDKAGVRHFDWLWELNGVPLKRNGDLKAALSGLHWGSEVPAKVRRDGQLIDVTLKLDGWS